ncbi:site-specific integrase [Methanolobus sp. ZRKC5]|uniref:site-specific integrase n=1 Tax=Methanolobus sp. ZRKC5 TaxID=3136295 RepID=UPI00313B69A9
MELSELKNDTTMDIWNVNIEPAPKYWKVCLVAMKHYTDYAKMTPNEILESAEKEVEDGLKMRNRKINVMLPKFKEYLENANGRNGKLKPSTINTYLKCIRSFYEYHDIQLPKKSRTKKSKQQNNTTKLKAPELEEIQQALTVCDLQDRAIILCGLSSGMGASEITSLKLQTYYDGYDSETLITTIDTRREKTDKSFITFLSPEATRAVDEYLRWRDTLLPTTIKSLINTKHKQRTTPDSYLFIGKQISNAYETGNKEKGIKAGDEEIRRILPDTLVKRYEKISNSSGLDTKKGEINQIRSHNMRTHFNTTMKSAGFDSEMVEFFMGHTLGGAKDAYFSPELLTDIQIQELKNQYSKFVPHLIVQKELVVADSKDYQELEEEVQKLKAQNAQHKVERYELETLRKDGDAKYEKLHGMVTNVAQSSQHYRMALEEIMELVPDEHKDKVKEIQKRTLQEAFND